MTEVRAKSAEVKKVAKKRDSMFPRSDTVVVRQPKNSFRMYWQIYVVLLFPIVWYIIFAYIPMGGLSLAFKDYKANLGILRSPFSGLKNFRLVFKDPAFFRSIVRTRYESAGSRGYWRELLSYSLQPGHDGVCLPLFSVHLRNT